MTSRPVVFLLSARSAHLAAQLAEALSEVEIHAPDHANCAASIRYKNAIEHLRGLYADNRAIIGICASAILIRAVAPLLSDKRQEPALIAVDETGEHIVPLLGGHRGGNALARKIAQALDGKAAITTASDQVLGVALDEPPSGWRLRSNDAVKAFASRLMDGESACVHDPGGLAGWLAPGRFEKTADAALQIEVTHRQASATSDRLVYHPPILALGVGCERGTDSNEVRTLVERVFHEQDLAMEAVACVVSLDLKAAEPALHELAELLQAPFRLFDRQQLLEQASRLATPSFVVAAEVGVPGVAEAAALAAVGPTGKLIVPKQKSQRATCAVAIADHVMDAGDIGRSRGCVRLVGLGPGNKPMRTNEATFALNAADMLVGYGLYLDLAGPAYAGKEQHRFPLGAEKDRCQFALAKAAAGNDVALLCSGDPGIYAMSALVLELVEHSDDPAIQRVEIQMVPGVSAMQAAAARIGAPLGHDFAVISLSDLLTPWDAIEQRLRAAAQGDFVLALYNPVSNRRRIALERARDILLEHRSKSTPVILGRNMGRSDERMDVIDLQELHPDLIDMLTVVLIGSRSTRRFDRVDGGQWVYTPRGYQVG